MWPLMPDYVQELASDDAIRVVILRGAGEPGRPQSRAGNLDAALCSDHGPECPVDAPLREGQRRTAPAGPRAA